MADQSVSFDSLLANLDAEIAAAEKAAAKFLADHRELDLQFRGKGDATSQERILRAFAPNLTSLDADTLAEVLRILGADLMAVIGFLAGEMVAKGIGRTSKDAVRLMVAKVQAWGAPTLTLTDAVAAYAEIIAAA